MTLILEMTVKKKNTVQFNCPSKAGGFCVSKKHISNE